MREAQNILNQWQIEGTNLSMKLTREEAVSRAREDLAERLGIAENRIEERSVSDEEFPDMALGAALKDEMSGQMITPGWRIRLRAEGQDFEYRANKNQIRLIGYKGLNYKL